MPALPHVGVLGASSLVGRFLLPQLARRHGRVLAVSRSAPGPTAARGPNVAWCRPGDQPSHDDRPVPHWITLCPIWSLAAHGAWLRGLGVRRLVALSSTSIHARASSPDAAERRLATRLADAEDQVTAWCAEHGIALTILRPTMIYDGRSDGNVAVVAAVVRRIGWFPLCAAGLGLRQPVHAGDVAAACLAALDRPPPRPCYTLSGGEALPFRELVVRTCRAHGLPSRTLSLPPWAWRTLATVARGLGIAGAATAGSGRRMNEDLSCDHAEAADDLGFRPRPFAPGGDTLPEAVDGGSSQPCRPRDDR